MRADRLLSILLLLQANRKLTAHELAERLEVSERTIHRDLLALSGIGVPVVADRGNGGGWSLLEGYRTTLTGLHEDEIQALFLSGIPNVLNDLGLRAAFEDALLKLFATLPNSRQRSAEYVRQRIHIDGAGWYHSPERVPQLLTLQEAIWSERRLRMLYQRSEAESVERVVDPLGLVAKGSVWYLIAAVNGEPRTYRVSRVQAAELLTEACVPVPGFDLAEFWEKSTTEFRANLPRYPVRLRARVDIIPQLGNMLRFAKVEQARESDDSGWCDVFMLFEDEHNAAEHLIGFGNQVCVLEPETLREMMVRLAREVLSMYADE